MLLFFLSFRVYEAIGAINYIKYAEGDELRNIIDSYEKTVVFFSNNTDELSFANFAIFEYFKTIKFVHSNELEGISRNCSIFPCIIPFSLGNRIKINEPSVSASLFSLWCESLVKNNVYEIMNVEHLRSVLQESSYVLFGVEHQQRPHFLPDNIRFYFVSKNVLRKFGISVSPGYYLYRSSDSEFIRINGNVKQHLKSPLVDLKDPSFVPKEYLAGYVVNSSNSQQNIEEIQILHSLAHMYPEKIDFSVFHGGLSIYIRYISQTHNLKDPFFIVMKNGNESSNEIITGNNLHNISHISKVLSKFLLI